MQTWYYTELYIVHEIMKCGLHGCADNHVLTTAHQGGRTGGGHCTQLQTRLICMQAPCSDVQPSIIKLSKAMGQTCSATAHTLD